MRQPLRPPTFSRAALPVLLACGAFIGCGGGDGASGLPPGSLDVLVQDGPPKDLASFALTIDSVRLIGDGDTKNTKELLASPQRVELLALQEEGAWMRTGSATPGTYVAARVSFDSGSIVARAKDGATVPVTAGTDTFDIPFETALRVTGKTDHDLVVLDFDLEESLSGDVAGMELSPDGHARHSDGAAPAPLAEVRGIVQSASFAQREIVLELFADDDLTVSLDDLPVLVEATSVLLDVDDVPASTQDVFFSMLVPGSTLLEVRGALGVTDDGEDPRVVARLVSIEDQNEGDNVADEVKLEGYVASLAGGELALLWTGIEKGAAVATPVLAGLGDPATVAFDLAPGPPVFDADGLDVTTAGLAVGQRVEVLSADFVVQPFGLERIHLLSAPLGEATVVSNSGGGALVVHVGANEPWVTSGDVADDVTDVTVDASAAVLVLDTEARPTFDPADLAPGQLVRLRGTLDVGTTTVTAEEVVVHAGRLVGRVTATTPPDTFTVTLDAFHDAFGDQVGVTGPYTVVVRAGCAFEGDADSAQGLMDLFDGLGGGETLVVEVRGFDDGSAVDTIQALELELEVVP